MILLEIAIVLGAIYFGSRLGSIGIGYAGGVGVLLLALLGIKPGAIAIDVILIIMAVIGAIGAMQVAGGMDFLVDAASKLLRRHPKYITFLAPLVTYSMALMAGTSHTSFSTLPVIAEVAKEQGIRPSRPLSIAVVASQVAITASPISAAVVYLSSILEPRGVDYLQVLGICIPATFLAAMLTAFVTNFLGKDLQDDPVYQERLAAGLIKTRESVTTQISSEAKNSVWIFLVAIVLVMIYATLSSEKMGLIPKERIIIGTHSAIIVIMLAAAAAICVICRVDASKVPNASTFKSGMSACVCVLGVAWLGTTFVSAHEAEIKALAGNVLETRPWLLALTLFFASMLLYSQAATTRALMPTAIALGASSITIVASFPAVAALFVLPTYPTLLAAIEMDDTGSTRIGKYVFNHSFIVPGILLLTLSVAFGFVFGGLLL